MKKNKEIIQFLLLCFGLNFSMAGLFFALGLDYKGIEGIILAFLYMLMPALSAFIIEKINKKKNIKKRLLISFKPNKWFFVAWLITPLIAAATFGISLLLPEVSFSANMDGMFERYANILSPEQIEEMKNSFQNMPIHPFWITLLQGLFAGITINAIAGFGEELGWRGFLLRQLNQQSFLKASLLIGFIWGIWHSPIILMGHNYPQHPEIGVLMMTIWCILLSPLFLYITLKSKSVICRIHLAWHTKRNLFYFSFTDKRRKRPYGRNEWNGWIHIFKYHTFNYLPIR